MATITISRQMGSLGGDIANYLADLIGYQIIWREVINMAARRAGFPVMALAAIDELGLLDLCPSSDACEAYCEAMQQIMEELYSKGNVIIIGRAGQLVLRNHPSAYHVRLFAPVDLRASRIAERFQVSIAGARAQITTSDRFRANYIKKFYKADWNDPELYHLIINTGLMTVKEAALIIHQALKAFIDTNLLAQD